MTSGYGFASDVCAFTALHLILEQILMGLRAVVSTCRMYNLGKGRAGGAESSEMEDMAKTLSNMNYAIVCKSTVTAEIKI